MIIANWKCNGSKEMIFSWGKDYERECDDNDIFVGVAPPSIYFSQFSREESLSNIVELGVQDVDHLRGRRTGAISVDMLIDSEM
jgi:Triosephosphate isomerase